jgi:hypothetical protein
MANKCSPCELQEVDLDSVSAGKNTNTMTIAVVVRSSGWDVTQGENELTVITNDNPVQWGRSIGKPSG